MFERPAIHVEPPIIRGNDVSFPFSCSPSIRKYFHTSALNVAYDVDVGAVPPSLLAVPAVANLVTVAWAAGADLHVETLDATFLGCLTPLRQVFQKMYPRLIKPHTIDVAELVSNHDAGDRYGLLFSGGVDSTCSFLKHRARRPTLIMVNGTDPPWRVWKNWKLTEATFWKTVKRIYRTFAAEEDTEITFVDANLRTFLDEARLNRDFRYYTPRGNWWIDVHHGIALLGITAPLTFVKRIRHLFISSSGSDPERARARPNASRPWITKHVAWANVTVSTEGYPMTRQEKIHRYLKPFIEEGAHSPLIRVCFDKFNDMNCSDCEKCHRTIMGLLVEHIDPNSVGFQVDAAYFDRLKETLTAHIDQLHPRAWQRLKTALTDPLPDLHGSRRFFEWLRTFTFSVETKTPHPLIALAPVFVRKHLPEPIKRLVRRHVIKEEVS